MITQFNDIYKHTYAWQIHHEISIFFNKIWNSFYSNLTNLILNINAMNMSIHHMGQKKISESQWVSNHIYMICTLYNQCFTYPHNGMCQGHPLSPCIFPMPDNHHYIPQLRHSNTIKLNYCRSYLQLCSTNILIAQDNSSGIFNDVDCTSTGIYNGKVHVVYHEG